MGAQWILRAVRVTRVPSWPGSGVTSKLEVALQGETLSECTRVQRGRGLSTTKGPSPQQRLVDPSAQVPVEGIVGLKFRRRSLQRE